MVIDSSGNVGIGTIDPSAKLSVLSTTQDSPSLTWNGSGQTIIGDNVVQLAIGRINSDPFPIYLQGRASNNTVRDIVLQVADGNVGIGTIDPQYKLEVAGDIKLGELGTLWFSDEPLSVEKIVATTSTLDYYSDSLHKFYESDSNVERATFNVNSTSGRLYFDGDSDTYFTREAANSHVFVNAGSESLRINASGNVGI